jgi:hypothetical protein
MLSNMLLRIPFASQPLTFVGASAQTAASSSTPVFSLTSLGGGLASSPSIGDIVIAAVTFANTTNRDITCSGYAEIADLYSGNSQLGVYYKVLTASDTSVTFGLGVSTTSCCTIHVWRNQNATQLDATTTTSATTSNAPSITTVTNGAIVIAVGSAEGGPFSNLTTPSGMTNGIWATSASTFGIGMASRLVTAAGAYDPPGFGGGPGSGSPTYCSATLAIRPY